MTTPMRSTRRWYPRHFWLGIAIGSFIAIPVTIGVQLAWTWVKEHPVVLLTPWLPIALVFLGLWLWARRRPAASDYKAENAIAGAIIAIVLGPWVVTLVLMFGGFLLEHWLWSWAITATIVAITQTIRLIVGRRRP
ncbi:hypothetical protein IT414_00210 [bacterium]|nr:hypothetical protein [bacterium]